MENFTRMGFTSRLSSAPTLILPFTATPQHPDADAERPSNLLLRALSSRARSSCSARIRLLSSSRWRRCFEGTVFSLERLTGILSPPVPLQSTAAAPLGHQGKKPPSPRQNLESSPSGSSEWVTLGGTRLWLWQEEGWRHQLVPAW